MINTISFGIIYPISYFVIEFRGEKTGRILLNSSANNIKYILEKLSSVSGTTITSRAVSTNSIGFRWAQRFQALSDDAVEGKFDVKSTGMQFSDPAKSRIEVLLMMTNTKNPDWVANDGNLDMCTLRYSSYQNGSETNIHEFEDTVLPEYFSLSFTLALGLKAKY